MIPRENIHKGNKIKFQGQYMPWSCVVSNFYRFIHFMNPRDADDFYQRMMGIAEENLIIPLELSRATVLPKDKKGCRIYDWKILSNRQVKNAMNIVGACDRVKVTKMLPITMALDEDSPPMCPEYETYDKFLNVTYLVNDEFLQEWCTQGSEVTEKNIAKKEVKDCSVGELLFAIKRKLEGKDEKHDYKFDTKK